MLRQAEAMTTDLARRLGVTAAALFCGLGTLFGFGVIGTRVEETSGGALAADATLLAPGGPAFSIWSLLYLGFAAYAIWQWTSGGLSAAARRTGWLAAASLVLNATWLLVTQAGWVAASVVVILGLLGVLVALVRRLTVTPAEGGLARLLLDGVFGLYLGWVSVATGANLMAALEDAGVAATSTTAIVVAVVILVILAVTGLAYARWLEGRWAPAAAMVWGLAWVSIARWTDEPHAPAIAVLSAVVALVIVGGTSVAFVRRRRQSAR